MLHFGQKHDICLAITQRLKFIRCVGIRWWSLTNYVSQHLNNHKTHNIIINFMQPYILFMTIYYISLHITSILFKYTFYYIFVFENYKFCLLTEWLTVTCGHRLLWYVWYGPWSSPKQLCREENLRVAPQWDDRIVKSLMVFYSVDTHYWLRDATPYAVCKCIVHDLWYCERLGLVFIEYIVPVRHGHSLLPDFFGILKIFVKNSLTQLQPSSKITAK